MGRTAAAFDVFHAIADANRRAMLDLLAEHPTSVGALAEHARLSYSAASQHLSILRAAGLVERRERGRERIYSVNAGPLREVFTWSSGYERFWRSRVARLRRVLDRETDK
jgi:DNA-binding transcriptional ArsR family regulator